MGNSRKIYFLPVGYLLTVHQYPRRIQTMVKHRCDLTSLCVQVVV